MTISDFLLKYQIVMYPIHWPIYVPHPPILPLFYIAPRNSLHIPARMCAPESVTRAANSLLNLQMLSLHIKLRLIFFLCCISSKKCVRRRVQTRGDSKTALNEEKNIIGDSPSPRLSCATASLLWHPLIVFEPSPPLVSHFPAIYLALGCSALVTDTINEFLQSEDYNVSDRSRLGHEWVICLENRIRG